MAAYSLISKATERRLPHENYLLGLWCTGSTPQKGTSHTSPSARCVQVPHHHTHMHSTHTTLAMDGHGQLVCESILSCLSLHSLDQAFSFRTSVSYSLLASINQIITITTSFSTTDKLDIMLHNKVQSTDQLAAHRCTCTVQGTEPTRCTQMYTYRGPETRTIPCLTEE